MNRIHKAAVFFGPARPSELVDALEKFFKPQGISRDEIRQELWNGLDLGWLVLRHDAKVEAHEDIQSRVV